MKNLLIISFVFVIIINNTTIAQTSKSESAGVVRVDKLFMISGEIKEGKVTDLGDEVIKFIHIGESLTYSFKRPTVAKIEFASGRIEVITKSDTTKNKDISNGKSVFQNKIAVLPISYLRDGDIQKNQQMEFKVQNDAYSLLTKNAATFEIQDPNTTNALLVKNGITRENYKGYTMPEVCEMLGVEYVVMGTVTIEKKGSTGYSNQSVYTNNSNKGYVGISGSSSTTEQFKTNVELFIYNNDGNLVYSKSRNSFFNTSDAFQMSIQYILKRSPIWSK